MKLLRVLQEQEFERVGDTKTIRVDCRVVAATNRDLLEEIEAGRFRDDLYYRLNVVPIYLPALRERTDDVPLLVEFFLRKYAEINKKPIPGVTPDVLEALKRYSWPGNVRELQNYVERAIVLSQNGGMTLDLMPAHVRGLAPQRTSRQVARPSEQLTREFVSMGLMSAGEADKTCMIAS